MNNLVLLSALHAGSAWDVQRTRQRGPCGPQLRPDWVCNRIPDDVRVQFVERALDQPYL